MESPFPWMNSVALTREWRLVAGKELFDMRSDPGQTRNVAAQHPGVVKMLSDRYDDWRERMSTGFLQWTRIPIGTPAVNLTDLTCFDWHGDIVPSNQEMVSNGLVANGIYALYAERAGDYEITLRQRPAYVPHRIEAELAKIFLNGRELEPVRVPPGAGAVSFAAKIDRGDVNLGTQFISAGKKRGAYYVDVRLKKR